MACRSVARSVSTPLKYTLTALSPHLEDTVPLVIGAFEEESILKAKVYLVAMEYREITVKVEPLVR